MTFDKLLDKWSRNINSEYIVPTLNEFKDTNIIISIEQDSKCILKHLKSLVKQYKQKVKENLNENI